MFTQYKSWRPYISPFDPCKPIEVKYYATPHNCIWVFNHGLPQFQTPREALMAGTLWPQLFSPYPFP